ATDNKTLGRFELVGIPPAPRGVPQVEVTFDIDSNGIVSVSAKDLGTGKEQSIRITASSGLSDEEVKRMVKDAEMHAEDDKKKKQLIESRNNLDSLIYSTEKSLGEISEKLSADDKGKINTALEDAKKALESGDLESIKKASEELNRASHRISEEIYKKATAGQQQAQPSDNGSAAEGDGKDGGGVVDADFEEVKDNQ
ncbi:MAG: molecular chaperone DnaK, partial [Proteobacteria bacterium]